MKIFENFQNWLQYIFVRCGCDGGAGGQWTLLCWHCSAHVRPQVSVGASCPESGKQHWLYIISSGCLTRQWPVTSPAPTTHPGHLSSSWSWSTLCGRVVMMSWCSGITLWSSVFVSINLEISLQSAEVLTLIVNIQDAFMKQLISDHSPDKQSVQSNSWADYSFLTSGKWIRRLESNISN